MNETHRGIGLTGEAWEPLLWILEIVLELVW